MFDLHHYVTFKYHITFALALMHCSVTFGQMSILAFLNMFCIDSSNSSSSQDFL